VASTSGKNHSKVLDARSKTQRVDGKITMEAMRDKVHRVAHPRNVVIW
jgi:hypothetical protein